MCFGSPKMPAQPVPPAPVMNPSPVTEDLAPELKLQDEVDPSYGKKKAKKSGTKALQTSGLSIPTGSSSGVNVY